jgi:hypothetical protein
LLLAAALVAFGAVLAGYLTYMVVHPPSWTLDLVDLHVYRDGGWSPGTQSRPIALTARRRCMSGVGMAHCG